MLPTTETNTIVTKIENPRLPGTADPSHLLPALPDDTGIILRGRLERRYEARYVPSDDGMNLVIGDPVPVKKQHARGGAGGLRPSIMAAASLGRQTG